MCLTSVSVTFSRVVWGIAGVRTSFPFCCLMMVCPLYGCLDVYLFIVDILIFDQLQKVFFFFLLLFLITVLALIQETLLIYLNEECSDCDFEEKGKSKSF